MFLKKNWGYFSSIARKTFVYDMKFWYKNISEIRNVTFILQNVQKRKKKL